MNALELLQARLRDAEWLKRNAPFPVQGRPYSQPTIPVGNEPMSGPGYPSEAPTSLSGGYPITNPAGRNIGMLADIPPPHAPMSPGAEKMFAGSDALRQMMQWWQETQSQQAQARPQGALNSMMAY